jgi:hypothetical protein
MPHEVVKEVPSTHRNRGFTDWVEVVRTAKEHPREWVKVGPYSPGIPHHIRRGVYAQFYDPDSAVPAAVQVRQNWSITSRTINKEPRQVDIFIKWIGQ